MTFEISTDVVSATVVLVGRAHLDVGAGGLGNLEVSITIFDCQIDRAGLFRSHRHLAKGVVGNGPQHDHPASKG